MTSPSSDHRPDLVPGQKRLAPTAFLKRPAKMIIIAVVLYSLAGFFIIPVAFTNLAPLLLPTGTGYSLTIGNTSFNPYTFALNIHDLMIYPNTTTEIDPDDHPLLAIDLIHLDLDPASLPERTLLVQELTISGLFMHLIRQPGPNHNPANLPPYDTPLSSHLPYSLQNITVRDSEIIFEDPASGIYQHAENIYLTLPVLTNRQGRIKKPVPSQLLQPGFSATLNGTPIGFNGETLRDQGKPTRNRFELDLQDLDLPTLLDYLPPLAQYKIEKGRLDIKLEIVFSTTLAAGQSLEINGEGRIRDLQAHDPQGRTATLRNGSFKVKLKPLSDYYQLEAIALDGLQLSSPGNWQMKASAMRITNAYLQPGKLDLGNIYGMAVRINLATELLTSIVQPVANTREITVQSLDLLESDILISSKADARGAGLRFSNTEIRGSSLTANPDNTGEIMISATMADTGRIDLQGELAVFPLTARLQYQAQELPFAALQPLLAAFIQPTMAAEHISGVGQISFPALEIAGSATVAGIRTIISPQRNSFSCPATTLNNFRLTLGPPALNIEELSFTKPLFKAERTDHKQPALAGFLFPSLAPNQKPLVTQSHITANTVRLTDGAITLTDLTAIPVAKIRIAALNTVLTGMVNQPGKPAPFSLQGTLQLTPHPVDYRLDNPGPPARIAMQGEVSLFGDRPELKSALEIHDFDLTSLAPYLAPLLGYQVDRGRLDLAADIKLHKQQLTSRNRFIIKEFKLGPSTSGRFNTPLAVALLTDTDRSISLDLGVNGNLKQPSFSYTDALAENIRNILTRTTGSPFSLVTTTKQRPEFLEYFVFPEGKAELDSQQAARLAILAAVLQKRPLLKLSITGQVDPAQDLQKLGRLSSGSDNTKLLRALAQNRGAAIREALVRAGITGSRLRLEEPTDIQGEEILLDLPATRADIAPLT